MLEIHVEINGQKFDAKAAEEDVLGQTNIKARFGDFLAAVVQIAKIESSPKISVQPQEPR